MQKSLSKTLPISVKCAVKPKKPMSTSVPSPTISLTRLRNVSSPDFTWRVYFCPLADSNGNRLPSPHIAGNSTNPSELHSLQFYRFLTSRLTYASHLRPQNLRLARRHRGEASGYDGMGFGECCGLLQEIIIMCIVRCTMF